MVVLRESDGAVFTHSSGVLEMTRALGFPWRLFAIFTLIPQPLRDAAQAVFQACCRIGDHGSISERDLARTTRHRRHPTGRSASSVTPRRDGSDRPERTG